MTPFLRVQAARQLDGAEHPAQVAQSDAAELVAQKAIVEPGVVGDEELALEPLVKRFRDGLEWRCVGHHRIGDPGQGLDHQGDPHAGIDQRRPLLDRPVGPDLDQADLGDAVEVGRGAGGFEVEIDDASVKHAIRS